MWSLTCPTGGVVKLDFESFATEGNFDFVYVYDGPDSTGQMLGQFSGYNVPPPLESTGADMVVEFLSDGSVVGPGFIAHFQCVRDACASPILLTAGTTITHMDSFSAQQCSWGLVCETGNPHLAVAGLTTQQDHAFLSMFELVEAAVDGEGEFGGVYDRDGDPIAQLHGSQISTTQTWTSGVGLFQYTSPGNDDLRQCASFRPATLQHYGSGSLARQVTSAAQGVELSLEPATLGYQYCANYNDNAVIQPICQDDPTCSSQAGFTQCRDLCDETQCEYFTFYPSNSLPSLRNRCYIYQPGECGELLDYEDPAAEELAETYYVELCPGCLVQNPCFVNDCRANQCANPDGECLNNARYNSEQLCETHIGHTWCGNARSDPNNGPTMCDTGIAGGARCLAEDSSNVWCGDLASQPTHGFTATLSCSVGGVLTTPVSSSEDARCIAANYTTQEACDAEGYYWLPPQNTKPDFDARMTADASFAIVRHVSLQDNTAAVSEVDEDAKAQSVEQELYQQMLTGVLVSAGMVANQTNNITSTVSNAFYVDGMDMWEQIDLLAVAAGVESWDYPTFSYTAAETIQTFMATVGSADLSAQFEPMNQGGAIYSDSGTVALVSCDVANNDAPNGAGAGVYSVRGNVMVTKGQFLGNSARQGGALYISRGAATILQSTFENNAAITLEDTPLAQAGGALYTTDSEVTLAQCVFRTNQARGDSQTLGIGGAVYIARGIASIVSSTFVDNLAGTRVNETYARDNSLIYNKETTSAPDMDQLGGAVYTAGGDITIRACTFGSNSAVLNAYGLTAEQQLNIDLEAALATSSLAESSCPVEGDCYCVSGGGGGGGEPIGCDAESEAMCPNGFFCNFDTGDYAWQTGLCEPCDAECDGYNGGCGNCGLVEAGVASCSSMCGGGGGGGGGGGFIYGCTDPSAQNYCHACNQPDSSACFYGDVESGEYGCMDPEATNFCPHVRSHPSTFARVPVTDVAAD
jgi:hypothetical protein